MFKVYRANLVKINRHAKLFLANLFYKALFFNSLTLVHTFLFVITICIFYLVVECLSVNRQQNGSFALVSTCRFEGVGDALLLGLLIMECERFGRAQGAHALLLFQDSDVVSLGEQGGTLHDVVQLTQVAGPWVRCDFF